MKDFKLDTKVNGTTLKTDLILLGIGTVALLISLMMGG